MIQAGQKIPSNVKLRKVTSQGVEEVSSNEFFTGRKVVMFSVPGAFTPTCSNTHLPGFVEKSGELVQKGADEIACLAVNDVHVMRAWAEAHGAFGAVTMLADGSGEFTRALGLELDLNAAGLGMRGKRAALIVEDGTVKSVEVEEKAGGVTNSGAEACSAKL